MKQIGLKKGILCVLLLISIFMWPILIPHAHSQTEGRDASYAKTIDPRDINEPGFTDEQPEVTATPSPYQLVFEGGTVPPTVLAGDMGVVWQSGDSMMMRALSTVEALNVAYARYDPEPLLVGEPVTITIHAEGGDGDYRYKLALYFNEDPSGERFTTRDQPILPFQASPVFTTTFAMPGYYMVHAYIEDSSGSQLVWADTKFLVTTAADYSDPAKVAGKVAELAAQCKASASGMYARAKWLHDWLTNNADYDQTYSIYKPEGVLLLGTGVCDSYSRAYQLLLKAVGIPCLYVSHDAGNHAWNLVQLGGYWYHVDVTWDDPVGGSEGHRYFLVSDDFMREDSFTHSSWYDSAGEVPPCPYNWGEAPNAAATPAPTAAVNPAPIDIIKDGLTFTIMEGEAFLKSVEVAYNAALTVPASVDGYPLRGIMGEAFSPDNSATFLSSLSLPEGLRSISPRALYSVRLPGILTIPASVTSIGEEAFANMEKTTGFQVAGGVSFTAQGGVLFSADMTRVIQYPLPAPASSYTLPSTVTRIDDGAFASCPNLTELHASSQLLAGTIYAFTNTDITIYGKDGTALQENLAKYSNAPAYIVHEDTTKKTASITITQDLTQFYNGMPVPLPEYTATGDGPIQIDFYVLVDGSPSAKIDSPPSQPGHYKVVVWQYEGEEYGSAKAEQKFQIIYLYEPFTGSIILDKTSIKRNEPVTATVTIEKGSGDFYILESQWVVLVGDLSVIIPGIQSKGTYTHAFEEGTSAYFHIKLTDAALGGLLELTSDPVSISMENYVPSLPENPLPPVPGPMSVEANFSLSSFVDYETGKQLRVTATWGEIQGRGAPYTSVNAYGAIAADRQATGSLQWFPLPLAGNSCVFSLNGNGEGIIGIELRDQWGDQDWLFSDWFPVNIQFLPGDATKDGTIDILDLVSIIDYIVSDIDPTSMFNADANRDGKVDILDLVWVIDKIVGG